MLKRNAKKLVKKLIVDKKAASVPKKPISVFRLEAQLSTRGIVVVTIDSLIEIFKQEAQDPEPLRHQGWIEMLETCKHAVLEFNKASMPDQEGVRKIPSREKN